MLAISTKNKISKKEEVKEISELEKDSVEKATQSRLERKGKEGKRMSCEHDVTELEAQKGADEMVKYGVLASVATSALVSVYWVLKLRPLFG